MTKTASSIPSRAAVLRLNAVLQNVNGKASDHYGEKLTCTGVLFDTVEREIQLGKTGRKGKAKKSSFHTVEYGWIDSYTGASLGTAEMIADTFGRLDVKPTNGDGAEWEEEDYFHIVFSGQVTNLHKEENGGDGHMTDKVNIL